jgi:hypothetical protein
MGRACSTNGGEEKCIYRIFVGKPEGKRPLGRPRRRWVHNIKMDLIWFILDRHTSHNINDLKVSYVSF